MTGLRALTLIRPMAAAIVHGTKRIENRTQNLPKTMRGVPTIVAVHAGLGWDTDYLDTVVAIDHKKRDNGLAYLEYAGLLHDQGIVGLMLLSGVVFTSPAMGFESMPQALQQKWSWFTGPYGYEIIAAIPFKSPIPCRGMLGFWPVPPAIEEEISASGAYDDLMHREPFVGA